MKMVRILQINWKFYFKLEIHEGGGTTPLFSFCFSFFVIFLVFFVLTSLQNLLDLDVVGTEPAVELEVVGVVQKGASEGEEKFLEAKEIQSKSNSIDIAFLYCSVAMFAKQQYKACKVEKQEQEMCFRIIIN